MKKLGKTERRVLCGIFSHRIQLCIVYRLSCLCRQEETDDKFECVKCEKPAQHLEEELQEISDH